jgi:hypothetical protein
MKNIFLVFALFLFAGAGYAHADKECERNSGTYNAGACLNTNYGSTTCQADGSWSTSTSACPKSIVAGSGTGLTAVTSIKDVNPKNVQINWETVKNATFYNLVIEDTSGKPVYIGTVKGTSLALPTGINYGTTYVVNIYSGNDTGVSKTPYGLKFTTISQSAAPAEAVKPQGFWTKIWSAIANFFGKIASFFGPKAASY